MENIIEEYSKWLDDSKEHLSNQALATYANLKDFLSEKEKQFVEIHLKNCAVCEDRLNRITIEDKEMEVAIEDKHEPVHMPEKPLKVFNLQKVFKYSVAAVIVIGLLLATYFSFFQEEKVVITERKKPEPKTDTLMKPTRPVSDSIQLVQEAGKKLQEDTLKIPELKSFAANEILENFVHRNVRSETEIEIIQPDIDDTIKFPYTFKWKQKSFSGSNKLIIVDNQNNSLYQAEIGGKEITIDQKLSNGLYYWKLESNGKLEAVGKFFIVKN